MPRKPGPSRNGSGALVQRLSVGAICLVYLAVTFLTFNQIDEDAFIYYRFADNIANGFGCVFNRFGERIESTSGPLWLALLVVVELWSLDVVIASKLLGIGFGLFSLLLLLAVSRRTLPAELIPFPALLLTVSVPFYSWAQRGMETSLHLFALLLLCFMLCEPRIRSFITPSGGH